jgi:hypothetical protein
MQNLLLKFGSIIRGQLYIEKDQSYKNTVLLSGSGRSGTTWLANIINNDNSFRYMFEPFHPELVSIVKHFNSRQYLRETDKNEEYLMPASRIFSGRVRNLWIDRYNKKSIPTKRLIKDIRVNLLLRWIKTNFPEIPIVFMLRHPFSVACSRIRLGWKAHLDDFNAQREFCEDFLIKFNEIVIRDKGEFEKQILMWCIENYVPITSLKSDEIYILFYENLFSNPEKEVRSLFNYLNLSVSDHLFDIIKKPSPMTKKNSPFITGEDPLLHWKTILTNKQIDSALKIMSDFGFDKIYCDEAFPQNRGIERLRLIHNLSR